MVLVEQMNGVVETGWWHRLRCRGNVFLVQDHLVIETVVKISGQRAAALLEPSVYRIHQPPFGVL